MEPLHYKNEYVTCLGCGVVYSTEAIFKSGKPYKFCDICNTQIFEREVIGDLYLISEGE